MPVFREVDDSAACATEQLAKQTVPAETSAQASAVQPANDAPKPAPAANAGRRVAARPELNIKRDVLSPLLAQCSWRDNRWVCPEPEPDERLLQLPWTQLLSTSTQSTVTRAVCKFYADEPDPNQEDKPRLDIFVQFASGHSVRYHPSASLIWSSEPQPTKAMQSRYNRAKNLGQMYRPAQPA